MTYEGSKGYRISWEIKNANIKLFVFLKHVELHTIIWIKLSWNCREGSNFSSILVDN